MTEIIRNLAPFAFYLIGLIAIASLIHSAAHCFRRAGEILLELAGLEIVDRDDA